MPLTISDDILHEAGLSEDEARTEIACRLFDLGRLTLWAAARWAGMARTRFEDQALRRGIPLYRPTADEVNSDMDVMRRLGA